MVAGEYVYGLNVAPALRAVAQTQFQKTRGQRRNAVYIADYFVNGGESAQAI